MNRIDYPFKRLALILGILTLSNCNSNEIDFDISEITNRLWITTRFVSTEPSLATRNPFKNEYIFQQNGTYNISKPYYVDQDKNIDTLKLSGNWVFNKEKMLIELSGYVTTYDYIKNINVVKEINDLKVVNFSDQILKLQYYYQDSPTSLYEELEAGALN